MNTKDIEKVLSKLEEVTKELRSDYTSPKHQIKEQLRLIEELKIISSQPSTDKEEEKCICNQIVVSGMTGHCPKHHTDWI